MGHYLTTLFFLIIIGGSFMYAEESNKQNAISSYKLEGAEFVLLDNGFRVWTKRMGNGPIKILTLHGGPGCTHEYFECFENFFPKEKYQIIFYDQLGSYHSDQPDDLSLWTVERFCDEVEQVRQALGLEDFYLYGQSWGGLLAIEYTLKYQHHLRGVILSNITGSVESYIHYLNQLRANLPQGVQDRLKFYEEKEDFLNPEYEKIMFEEVYGRHLCRLKPWPEALVRTFAHLNAKVYQTVQGPNEFVVTGNFKNWNRWNDLKNIAVPTLIICGRFDTMNPKDIERMGELIPHSTVKICENGSHCALFDDQENYFQAIHRFFDGVENRMWNCDRDSL
jgi:proline iminopeptidase